MRNAKFGMRNGSEHRRAGQRGFGVEPDIRLGVELLCYTSEEYARKREELGIVRTATEEGVELLGPESSFAA